MKFGMLQKHHELFHFFKWKRRCNETAGIKTVMEFNIETMGFNPAKQLETKMFIALKRDGEIVLCNYTIHHTLI